MTQNPSTRSVTPPDPLLFAEAMTALAAEPAEG
jgi:hypothetical protein